jgi:hypothetical protein
MGRMQIGTTPPRRTLWLVAGLVTVVSAVGGGPATSVGAQAGDPVVVTVNSPLVTQPGSQVTFTFTISDVPPCGANEITTLDSADFVVTDPSGLSTIAGFTTNQGPGSVSSNLSPDKKALTLLFDSAFPCDMGTTSQVTIDVTIDVPAAVPLGTTLTLDGTFRGFGTSANSDYTVEAQGVALVAEPAAPPTPPPAGGNGSAGNGGNGASPSAGVVPGSSRPEAVTSVSQPVAAATPVRATARFTG